MPNFPKSKEPEHHRSRGGGGMGSGQHKPRNEDYDLCPSDGLPLRKPGDGETSEDVRREHEDDHEKRQKPQQPSWPSGYPEARSDSEVAFDREWEESDDVDEDDEPFRFDDDDDPATESDWGNY